MDKKQQAVLALVAVGALLGLALWAIIPPATKIPQGLDLRGGLSVIIIATPGTNTAQALVTDQMSQAELVIRNRVDKLGIAESSVQKQGTNALLVQIPGIRNPQQALKTIGTVGQLQFRQSFSSVPAGVPVTLTAQETTVPDRQYTASKGRTGNVYVLGPALLKGDALSGAQVGVNSQNNSPQVDMTFNADGAKKFGDITTKLVGKNLAIVLDNVVQSAPVVEGPITDGRAVITGRFTFDEAKQLALVLQTGALPVAMSISRSQIVGPTLGQDSLRQGVLAAALGLLIVAIYMAFFYRGLGVLSWLSLAVFMTLLLGTLTALGNYLGAWSLTLPGVAGIVFSIGSAADSSILLFERFKEEVRGGKTVRTAVHAGFRHALGTVIDADLVAFITALVIYIFAIGPVKGFAFTLMLGMALDLVTLTLFTRSVLVLLVDSRVLRSKALVGVKAEA